MNLPKNLFDLADLCLVLKEHAGVEVRDLQRHRSTQSRGHTTAMWGSLYVHRARVLAFFAQRDALPSCKQSSEASFRVPSAVRYIQPFVMRILVVASSSTTLCPAGRKRSPTFPTYTSPQISSPSNRLNDMIQQL